MDLAKPFTKRSSVQGGVYVATFVVGLVVELIGEIVLYRTIPDDKSNLKARFWARYVVEVAAAAVVGCIGYVAVEALSHSGWSKTAWLLAVLPTAMFLTSAFVLQGVNTVLDRTTGVGCVGVVRAAMQAKSQQESQKKVCDNPKP